MDIKKNLNELKDKLPDNVKLVAISKTKSAEEIMQAYESGHKIFGENKAQELISKQPQLPEDIEWHFVGHMQRNKVKYLIPFVKLIHSIDSLKLLKEVNKRAKNIDCTISCLLQFHIAEEETKFGLNLEEAKELLQSDAYQEMQNISIKGVMGMATLTDDKVQVRKEFKMLRHIFEFLKNEYFSDKDHFKEISSGMTADYEIAIEEGSTMVRIGSLIFGPRN